jgi:hypothetical protein
MTAAATDRLSYRLIKLDDEAVTNAVADAIGSSGMQGFAGLDASEDGITRAMWDFATSGFEWEEDFNVKLSFDEAVERCASRVARAMWALLGEGEEDS